MTVAGRGSVGAGSPPPIGPIALAISTLRDLDMPWVEIDQILAATDPRIVRRYLDLHLERSEERLAQERAILAGIEALLAAGAYGESDTPAERGSSLSVGAATARNGTRSRGRIVL